MVESGATLSACGAYRYELWRRWSRGRTVAFVMLNPSTADHREDDPTIRRCVGFAKAWGFGGLAVYNLFALRSTDPDALLVSPNSIGVENDAALRLAAALYPGAIVCAWGAHKAARQRGPGVTALLHQHGARPQCIRTTKSGAPSHPLYLPATETLRPFPASATPQLEEMWS